MSLGADPSIPTNPSTWAPIDLVNSTFADHLGVREPIDRISSPAWQRWFFDRYDLAPEPRRAEVGDLVTLRGELRRVLERWAAGTSLRAGDVRSLDARLAATPVRRRVGLTDTGVAVRHEPMQRDWAWALTSIAASAVELVATGEPIRLKRCANPACSWMFYDETINRSKQFCSTSPCASLVRVRRFRGRTSGAAGTSTGD